MPRIEFMFVSPSYVNLVLFLPILQGLTYVRCLLFVLVVNSFFGDITMRLWIFKKVLGTPLLRKARWDL